MLLTGVRVVEVGQALAGPLAGVILADLGADVIKVEKPDGGDDARQWGPPFIDETSLMFRATNRNKRSVALDLKSPDDVARLKELVVDADILIQNLRPGVVEKLGIDAAALQAINPRLIYCNISAFGSAGPLKLHPGFDPLLQAYGGVMTLTGRPEDPPTFCAPAINDKATGMWCVIGALAALKRRDETGAGCVIDTSLFESAVSWVDGQLNGYRFTGEVPVRHGAASAGLVPYQTFETADRPICIAAGNNRLFVRFAETVGHPEWAEDPRFETGPKRAENRAVLIPLIEEVMPTRTRAEWISALEAAGVPCSPVNDVGELSASDQLAAVEIVQNVPRDDFEVVALPIQVDGERPSVTRGAPAVGEHNAEIFGDDVSG